MTNVFPSLPGLGFSVMKSPKFNTRIQRGVSGRELRLTFQGIPTWEFTLTFEFLRDFGDIRGGFRGGGPAVFNELRQLMGFYLGQQGSLTPFLFDDPSDDNVVRQLIGTGDGTTRQFQLTRALTNYGSTFNEPIIAPNVVYDVYLNTVEVGGYSVGPTGVITFVTAPGVGVAITASFSYYFLCRFSNDSISFENFLYQLWSLKELKLQSVLL